MEENHHMKRLLPSLIIATSASAHAGNTPSEAPVQAVCQEHIASEPRLRPDDWPKQARGREVNAYVVISYTLDGSGKARNAVVTDSRPKSLFDKTALGTLERTEFTPGVAATSCVYVRTYDSIRRSGR